MLENVLRSSSIIVAQAGHSSTLKLENALRSSSLLLATALHSRPSSAYIGAHAVMRLALIHALMLMLDARDALRSSWLMLAIALRSSFLMLATALRSSSLIVAHARREGAVPRVERHLVCHCQLTANCYQAARQLVNDAVAVFIRHRDRVR